MTPGKNLFVIGGGPAGLAAAIAAAQRGFAVTLADGSEPPIDKACGEGLLPDALDSLQKLGVHFSENEGQRLRGLRFIDEFSSASADFHKQLGLGMRRTELHEKLVRRAQECGVNLLWRTPVAKVSATGVSAGGQFFPARWIIGADGSGSQVRRWSELNNDDHYTRRFAVRRHYRVTGNHDWMEVHWRNGMQAYVTPLGGGEICIACVSADSQMRMPHVLAAFPVLAAKIAQAIPSSAPRGAVTAMHRLKRVYAGNVALVGDASGSVDAISGEGMAVSFRQAIALARALENGSLPQYQSAHRAIARRPQFMSKVLLELDRCSRVRPRVLRALAAHPATFQRLLLAHFGAASFLQIARAGISLGYQMLWA